MLSAQVSWARNELGGSWLPVEAWVLLGDRVGPAVEPRTWAEIRASYHF